MAKDKKTKEKEFGTNCKASVDGDILTLEIDLSEEGEESGTGRSMVVAKTNGFEPVPDTDVAIKMFVTRKKGK